MRKYAEMHRLVREPDGSEVLYVGAENWPFPFPLIAANGAWHFDTEAGMEQLLLRRIGEDELAAIATCRALIEQTQNAPTSGSPSASEGAQPSGTLREYVAGGGGELQFRGYFFRVFRDTQTPALSSGQAAGATQLTVVAYPAEYRVTGVLTFVADRDGTVYETDLGPQTVPLAKTLRAPDPTLSWRAIP